MALPKNKTRKVSVSDTDFRWGRFVSETAVDVRAELLDNPRSQMLARIESEGAGGLPVVGPGLAAALIQAALDEGWKPADAEPREFRLENIRKLVADHDLRTRKSLTCVVIAPLDAGAARVRDTLTRAVRELGLQVRDVADLAAESSMVTNVTRWIDEADFIVADVTRRNPNVFYEIGYAQALKKPTIYVVEGSDARDVPLALSGNIFVVYSQDNLAGLHGSLRKALLRQIRAMATQ